MASHERNYFKKRDLTTKIYPKKVFINQLGYKPDDVKQAVFSAPLEKFWVENSAGEVCFEGNVRHFGLDECSQDDVYVADFSAFDRAGKYRVKGDNGEESFEFEICENVYNTLTFDVLKAFYYLRCGTELKPEHAGVYTHAPCHTGRYIRLTAPIACLKAVCHSNLLIIRRCQTNHNLANCNKLIITTIIT